MIVLSTLLGTVLTAALLWKIYHLLRAPHDLPLRAVTFCIGCAMLSFPFGREPVAARVDALAGAGTAKLLQNALLLGTVYCLMCFYLFSASDRRRGQVRARWELVPLTATVLVITAATVAGPAQVDGATYTTADMRATPVALFYLVAGLYIVYALAAALRWTWRYARASRGALATGLWMAAASMAVMVVASAARAVFIVVRWSGSGVPPSLNFAVGVLLALATPLFVVAVVYPGAATRFAALRVWSHHRRMYRRLRPLWLLLHEAYPEDALTRVPTNALGDALRIRGVHRRYYRRVIECRDGLVRISPYVARLGGGPAAGEGPESPAVLAEQLRRALREYATGGAVSGQAVALAIPDGEGLDADVRQLVALSDALTT